VGSPRKAGSKKNRKNNLYGNLIDLLSRNTQDAQTIGLPVGPDTSRLIAEIVGSAIDNEVQKKISKSKGRVFRFVDDFTIGCHDTAEAEKALAVIRKAANHFELELNFEKTLISKDIQTTLNGWKSLLRSQVPIAPYRDEDMKIFVFRVAEMAKLLPNINVERFAIQNARLAFLGAEKWSFLENYLITLYKRNSTLVDIVSELFVLRQELKKDVSLETVTTFIETRLPILCDQQRNGEAAWLMSMAIKLELKLGNRSVEGFYEEVDPFIALLISDANKLGFVKGKIDRSTWNSHLTTPGLDEEMWLYGYEATLKGLSGSSISNKFIKDHPYFSCLLDKKVEFYRSDQGFSGITNILSRRKKENIASQRLAADFDADHEFDFEDLGDEDFNDDNFYEEEVY
jgi:Reverse transcriptase (RNA-dependent DNA polymerase)